MGAEWHSFYVLLGIKVPSNKVRSLWEALGDAKENRLKGFTDAFPVTVKLYEKATHTRTECEDGEKTLARCVGFLGVICTSASPDQISDSSRALAQYLEQNKNVLTRLKINDVNPRVYGGIYHELNYFWESTRKRSSKGSKKICNYDEDESLYTHAWLQPEDEAGNAGTDSDSSDQ